MMLPWMYLDAQGRTFVNGIELHDATAAVLVFGTPLAADDWHVLQKFVAYAIMGARCGDPWKPEAQSALTYVRLP